MPNAVTGAAMLLFLTAFLAAPGGTGLSDLQVGENEGIARVMLVCESRCSAAQTDGGPGVYRIIGLANDVAIDLPGDLVRSITIASDPVGAQTASILTIGTPRPPRRVRLSRCEENALCFDLDLKTPAPPPILAGMEADLENLERTTGSAVGLRAALERESGERLAKADCDAARVTLRADAWALGAFRTVALCRAIEGARGEADGFLARLQALKPTEETARLRRLIALPPEPVAATRLR